MKLRNAVVAGLVSVSAAAALAGPVCAAQASALKADNCSVRVNIAHPVARQWETLTVTSAAAKTTVQVKIRYKTVSHTWKFITGGNERAAYQFNVGHPTSNYRVTLAGTVTGAPRGYKTGATCATSFVPE